jgi:hypothetical protein
MCAKAFRNDLLAVEGQDDAFETGARGNLIDRCLMRLHHLVDKDGAAVVGEGEEGA